VDDENYLLGNGIWLYVESNGVWVEKLPGVYLEGTSNANLQRGYYDSYYPDDQEICFDGTPGSGYPGEQPDLILF
jgi:hypothetical protein